LDKDFKGLFDSGHDEEGGEQVSGRSSTSGFMQHFGWFYQASLVAEYERIPLQEAYELNTLNFLNDLAYLKSKAEYESELIKQAYGKKH